MASLIRKFALGTSFVVRLYGAAYGAASFTGPTANLDLNDPAAGWTLAGGRFNTDADGRTTETTSARVDLQFGDDSRNLRFGLAYDDTLRKQQGFANSAYQDHVMATLTDADLVQYLQPGPFGFVTFDFDAIKAATDWYSYAAANTESGGSTATGVSTGAIAETNVGTYLEANGEWDLAGRTLRYNGGVRYVGTSQRISGPVTVNGMTQWVALDTSYNELLPSAKHGPFSSLVRPSLHPQGRDAVPASLSSQQLNVRSGGCGSRQGG